jgi:transposase-like protein
MKRRYSKEIKDEVLGKIRCGQKVSEVSKAHGISEPTVRTWLERDTMSPTSETLELSRLRRENESLLRIIGQLTYEADTHKKNQRRERH